MNCRTYHFARLVALVAALIALPTVAFSAQTVFLESGGQIVVEAENFSSRTPDANGKNWLVVPDENPGAGPRIANARGGKYIQSLPDNQTGGAIPSLPPSIEYKVQINTTGLYRLFLRWDGNAASSNDSDTIFVDLVELKDGPGGAIADWYELNKMNDGNFAGTPWDGGGGFEQTRPDPDNGLIQWVINKPGIYTVRISQREDGAAADAFVLQLASLPEPTENGPPQSKFTSGAFDIIPKAGGDTGMVTLQLYRLDGFLEGTSVKLVKDGESPVDGANISFSDVGTTLNAAFDLTGRSRGLWDVVVTNPDGTTFTIPQGFKVEEGRTSKVWVDVLGLNVIRPGRAQTFHIMYGNIGNVDAVGVPLWIAGIPSGAKLDLGLQLTDPPLVNGETPIDLSGVPTQFDNGQQIALPLFLPRIPPGYTGVVDIEVTVNSSDQFNLRVWTNPPYFEPLFNNDLRNNVLECLLCAASIASGYVPGKDCIDAFGKYGIDQNKLLAKIWLAKDRKSVIYSSGKILFKLFKLLFKCLGDANPTAKAIKTVADIIDSILKGQSFVDCATTCGEVLGEILPVAHAVQPVNSFDPNDKIGSQGIGLNSFLSETEPLRYSIFFENLGTASAPTQEVVVTDQLDIAKLDLSTLSLGSISFGDKVITPPSGQTKFVTGVDLRPEKNLLVRVIADFDSATNVLNWRLTSIDPATGELTTDPLEGFLPPNTDAVAPKGSGSLLFTVMPKQRLATGTEIRNKATIVFDTNAPIETPEWFNTIDNSKPESQVLTLLATQTSTSFKVEWSGSDEGAGIKDYTIFVSEDNGSFSPWLTNTPDTQAMFIGQNGHSYAFYSVARDQTGNVEDAPVIFDTSTTVTVVIPNQPPLVNAGPDMQGVIGQSVTLQGSASDPDSGPAPLNYSWTQTSGPTVTLSGANTLNPSFSPMMPGVYVVALKVSDGKDFASDSVTVTVADVPIRVIQPNGGEIWKVGLTQTIMWSMSPNLVNPKAPAIILFSKDGGTIWIPIRIDRRNKGSYTWKPGSFFTTQRALIQVCTLSNQNIPKPVCDVSDATFTITK